MLSRRCLSTDLAMSWLSWLTWSAPLTAPQDKPSAHILEITYRDEKRHIACGAKWIRFLCERAQLAIEPTFHNLVRENFNGAIKPPFNQKTRAEAGLTPGFYKPLILAIYSRQHFCKD